MDAGEMAVEWRKILRLSDDEIHVLFNVHLRERGNNPEPIAFARMIEVAMITRLVSAHAPLPLASRLVKKLNNARSQGRLMRDEENDRPARGKRDPLAVPLVTWQVVKIAGYWRVIKNGALVSTHNTKAQALRAIGTSE